MKQRVNIKFYVKLGKTFIETLEMLPETYETKHHISLQVIREVSGQ